MNNALVTTGLAPLTINSVETFELGPFLDGLPWDLSGGSVTLRFTDPTGANTSFPATLGPANSAGQVYSATVNWVVVAPVGSWVRAWDVTDRFGVRQISRPIVFTIISSPS